jgi:hypothetical protein
MHNERLAIYTLRSVTRLAVDEWVETAKRRIALWDKPEPRFDLHDLSHPKITITPYSRARSTELSKFMPDQASYTAVVLPRTFATTLISLYFNVIAANDKYPMRAFMKRDEARAWLEVQMKARSLL